MTLLPKVFVLKGPLELCKAQGEISDIPPPEEKEARRVEIATFLLGVSHRGVSVCSFGFLPILLVSFKGTPVCFDIR